MTAEFPEWLQEQPLASVVAVDLPPPNLADNTGDIDRLARALAAMGFSPLRLIPAQMDCISRRLRDLTFSATAIVGFAGHSWEILDLLPRHSNAPALGFAIDLGTSSIVFRLIDLSRRSILSERSFLNPQSVHGEDILSRIQFARTTAGHATLRNALLASCRHSMIDALKEHDLSPENVYAVACAGNTAMTHFFVGLDPSNLAREPYIPAANTFPICRAPEYGFDFLPNSLLYVFPNVGSYVGGDVVSGILATGLHRVAEPAMLIDVGTNAEVVLGNSDWLLACAGAAGPALEGGVVASGMQAIPGAIDHVRINRETLEPSFHVIGEGKPSGICGSGIIDLIAEMFASGILTVQGKLRNGTRTRRITCSEDGVAYVLVPAAQALGRADISISEIDVGIFLKSKAAMYTILSIISRKVGLAFGDIRKIFIAGSFGNRIDPEMAIRIGMIPDLPPETYSGVGNASLLGASMTLLDRSLLKEADLVRGRITYIELNVNLELMNEFRGALFLPHTNRRLFPSVRIPESWPGSPERGV